MFLRFSSIHPILIWLTAKELFIVFIHQKIFISYVVANCQLVPVGLSWVTCDMKLSHDKSFHITGHEPQSSVYLFIFVSLTYEKS
jgi:hypothetical protein